MRALASRLLYSYVLFGVFFGLCFLIVVYNAALFLATRDPGFGFYALYTSFGALTSAIMEGFAFPLLWPHWPQWNNVSLVNVGPVAFILAAQFVKAYLRLDKANSYFRWRGLTAYQALTFAVWASQTFLDYSLFAFITAGLWQVFAVLVFAISIYSSLHRERPAYFLLLAWTAFLISSSVTTTRYMGITPESTFTHYAFFIGAGLEYTLLSVGLADRFNSMRKEREEAKAELLEDREIALENQKKLTHSYARFVPEEFLHLLHKDSVLDLQLGEAVERELTILFADIRS
ncbi:MAG: 7TM-DISM domain-containing protein, partial [Leptospiraceae bacterium]|nr:7TM-DISM domain-containing protein [Leptospiraceae bacterium]